MKEEPLKECKDEHLKIIDSLKENYFYSRSNKQDELNKFKLYIEKNIKKIIRMSLIF